MNWREIQELAAQLATRSMEPLFMKGGWLAVHAEQRCVAPCPVHAPSDHVMKFLPLVWRSDRGFFERVCRHGTGHPDPDDLAFKKRTMTPAEYERRAYGVHGCCGECCREN